MQPDQLSLTLSAIADPTRRAILMRLMEGEASVKELAAPFAWHSHPKRWWRWWRTISRMGCWTLRAAGRSYVTSASSPTGNRRIG